MALDDPFSLPLSRMTELLKHLQLPDEPYIVLISGPFAERLSFTWPFAPGELPKEFVFRHLRGEKMSSKADLMNEFAAVLQFPSYFGHNWDALDECLADLEWLPGAGYVFVIRHALNTLQNDDDAFQTLLQVLDSSGREWACPIAVGEYWDRPPIPFHALLWEDKPHFEALERRVMKGSVPFSVWPRSN